MDVKSRLYAGQIKAFDNDFSNYGDYHPNGGQIHIWQPNAGGNNQLGWTVLHEGAHSAYGVRHEETGGAEWWANYCWLGD